MCQFRALKKICGPNDATPVIMYVIPVADVTVLPAATTDVANNIFNVISTAPTLAASKKWQPVMLRRKDIKFTNPVKGEIDANQGREERLVGFYPESVEEAFYNAGISVGSDVLVGWKNGNGKQQIWGTLENPVTVSKFDFDSSKSGFDIEFARDTGVTDTPPFYTGTFTI
ncbi:MAG: hypothetical protein ACK4Q5_06040 [Saprospiraceae bacterium]